MLLVAAAALSNLNLRLSLIVLAALVIRMDASWQFSLHEWDERFHALVAKNLIADPLKPTLYRSPAVAYDYRDWTSNHVWLHQAAGRALADGRQHAGVRRQRNRDATAEHALVDRSGPPDVLDRPGPLR